MNFSVVHGSDVPPDMGSVTAADRRPLVGLDVETRNDGTGLMHPNHMQLVTVQLAEAVVRDGQLDCNVYVVTDGFEYLSWVQDKFVVGHNLAFDYQQLAHHLGIRPQRVADTMVIEGMLSSAQPGRRSLSLKAATKRYLGKERDKSIREQISAGAAMTDDMLQYAADDASDTVKVFFEQYKQMKQWQPSQRVYALEMSLVPVIAEASYRGMLMDTELWLSKDMSRRDRKSTLELWLSKQLVGSYQVGLFEDTPSINLNSTVAVGRALAARGVVLPNMQRATIEYERHQFDEGGVSREILDNLLELSALRKAVSTYGGNWISDYLSSDGRVHTYFFQTKAETGRFSSSEPNITNLPRLPEYRECFVAPPGRAIIKADYAQQEPRVMAYVTQDPVLLDAFNKGEDPYLSVARVVTGKPSLTKDSPERRTFKTIVLALFYGMGVNTLAGRLGMSVPQAETVLRAFRGRFGRMYSVIDDIVYRAEESGYSETVWGRRRYVSSTDPGFRGKATNMVIQGTSADMIKLAAVLISKQLVDTDAFIINIVHDELVLECGKEDAMDIAKVVHDVMIQAAGKIVNVPFAVDVSVGRFWGDDCYGSI